MGIFFLVAKISNIFLGLLKFLIFLGGEGQMLGPSLRMKKNESTPHPGISTYFVEIFSRYYDLSSRLTWLIFFLLEPITLPLP